MKSHLYQFAPAELGRLLTEWIIPLIGLAVILRLGAASGLLPAPWPCHGVDETILVHQAQASQTRSDADLLLIGDSSCLTDVSGIQLQESLGGTYRVLNLGTLSYLGLNGYAELLSRYCAANPGQVRGVVVLLHPEMLRGVGTISPYLAFLSDFYAGADHGDASTIQGQISGLLGADIVWNRFWGRAPVPLPGTWGFYYGFNRDLNRFMTDHRGSAFDPHNYTFRPGQGNAEYRLAPGWESGCRALKAAMPPTAKLFIGITPVPASFAPPGYAAQHQRMLIQWGQWMEPDARLDGLPAILPDHQFASTTHLNSAGNTNYTDILARCLKPLLPGSSPEGFAAHQAGH